MRSCSILEKLWRAAGRISWRVALWICLLTLCPAFLHAHAVLLQTDPPAGSRLDTAPSQVTLVFNERVESVFNSIRVLDLQGRRLDLGQVQVEDGDTLVIPLQQLGTGSYGVFWRVISLDTHEVQGQFGFGVGAAAPSEEELAKAVPASSTLVPQWYFQLFKGMGLAGLALWLGGISFLIFIAGPVLRSSEQADERDYLDRVLRRSKPTMIIGALLFLASEAATLLGKTAVFAQIPFRQALSVTALGAVLSTTILGQWWAIRSVTAIVLLVLTWRWLVRKPDGLIPPSRWGPVWMVLFGALGSGVLATIAETSHAGAETTGTLLAVSTDWVHLAATAVWIGGLFHLLSALSLSRSSGSGAVQFVNRLAPRFSRMAQICVLALIATGIYSAWLHIPSWAAFLNSSYGQVLTAKLALVVGILFIGAVNWRWALPALASFAQARERASRWAAKLRQLVRAEVVLGGLILTMVAILTSLPPATAVSASSSVDMQQKNAGYVVFLRLEPNRVGDNQAQIQIRDSQKKLISNAKRVTVYLRSLDMDMGLETVQASPAANGVYQAPVTLSMAGKWLVSVEVSPPEGDTFVTEFRIPSTL